MIEIWKDVVNYEGLYQVSNMGRVKSLPTVDSLGRRKPGVIKKPFIVNSGYLVVNLKHNGKQKNKLVHRLVVEAFLSPVEGKRFINHIDGNKLNNRVENLEWCTRSENMKHAVDEGLLTVGKGENSAYHKLTSKDVDFIRKYAIPYHPEFGFSALARKFGVTDTTIKSVFYKRTWKEDESC